MIHVTTGSRLHFGLICTPPESPWHYGGLGLMIAEPGWKLTLERSPESRDMIDGRASTVVRITAVLQAYRDHFNDPGHVRIAAADEMKVHSGLGSGTQLTLAVSTGLRLLTGMARPKSSAQIADALGRSRRSAIGTFGFDFGGFVTDRGRHAAAPQLSRQNFPEDWRLVLVSPTNSEGLSGQREEQFFQQSRHLVESAIAEVTRLVNSVIVPAVAAGRYQQFADGLCEYGRIVGEYYATEQGGIYSSPVIRELAEQMKARGLPEPVQSSWGPTVCVPTQSAEHADRIRTAILDDSPSAADLQISIASGLNQGATVRTEAPADHRSLG